MATTIIQGDRIDSLNVILRFYKKFANELAQYNIDILYYKGKYDFEWGVTLIGKGTTNDINAVITAIDNQTNELFFEKIGGEYRGVWNYVSDRHLFNSTKRERTYYVYNTTTKEVTKIGNIDNLDKSYNVAYVQLGGFYKKQRIKSLTIEEIFALIKNNINYNKFDCEVHEGSFGYAPNKKIKTICLYSKGFGGKMLYQRGSITNGYEDENGEVVITAQTPLCGEGTHTIDGFIKFITNKS